MMSESGIKKPEDAVKVPEAGELLVDRIVRGVYKKDYLPNKSANFTGDKEQLALIRYKTFINSLLYDDLAAIRGDKD
jgi:hypothetical protein